MTNTYLPQTILVVGGTGHTGERLCLRLQRMGARVRVLTRHPDSPVARKLAEEGCEIFEGDCWRRWTVWTALEGCEAMVSCAHIRFSEVLTQACYRTGVTRFVAMSSTRRFSRVTSASVAEVLSGEAVVIESDIDWTILRPSMIYGGRRDQNVTRLVEWIRRRPFFPMFGNGQALVQPVFVEDVVSALMEALRRPATARRDYTLSGPEPITYVRMIEQILRALDREIRLLYLPVPLAMTALRLGGPLLRRVGVTEEVIRRMGEDKAFSCEPAIRELGFVPTTFEEGIEMKVRGLAEVESLYPSDRYPTVDQSDDPPPARSEGDTDE